jgi:peptidoglycan/LPS O-acetylase OafA/YrhL
VTTQAAAVRRGDHSPNLDLLRMLAVSFVVFSHLLIDNAMTHLGPYHSQTLGTLGVMIFFVHTCLVLMRSLERQDQCYGHRALAVSFLAARFFRIYPLSIFIVVVLAAARHMHAPAYPTLSTFLSNVFLVQNLTGAESVTPVLWSLPFEVQMYLFLPGLYWWTNTAAQPAWRPIVGLWCGFVALSSVLWRLGMNVDLIKFFPCFLPGVLAYCMRQARWRWPPRVLFSYVLAAALIYPLLVGIGASATVLSWFICLILGALIPMCSGVTRRSLRLCGRVVARYSYGIYLVHVSVMNFAFHYVPGIPRSLAWFIFLVGIIVLPYCLYHLIEKPGIDVGRLLVARLAVARVRRAQNI